MRFGLHIRRGTWAALAPRSLLVFILVVPALLLEACAGDPADGSPEVVASVAVAPDTLALVAGESRALSATVRALDGSVLAGRRISWRSSDTAVAAVDSMGRVRARGQGDATVTAAYAGKEGRARVRVQAAVPAVARLEIAPAGQISIRSGSTAQLLVRAFAADGTELFGRAVAWTSSDPRIARVDSGHVLVASEMGYAALTAMVEGQSAVVTVHVLSQVARLELDQPWLATAPGEVVQVQAYARDEAGNLLNKAVTWFSANPAVATVVAPGRVTGVAPGSTRVSATVEGVSVQLDVTVASWNERALLTLDGAAPPVMLFTVTRTDSVGTGATTYVQALGGSLRMLPGGPDRGRYQQRFWVMVWQDGQAGDWATLELSGTYANDANGMLVFRTSNDEILPVESLVDGPMAVTGTGTMVIAGKEVRSAMRLVYGAPQ